MAYLARRGWSVVGVDGVEVARRNFATEQGARVASTRETKAGNLTTLALDDGGAHAVDYLIADFYGVDVDVVGARFDAAFDRGGLVAVELDDRQAYADRLADLVKGRVLLVATEHPPFDGGKLGPPYNLSPEDVHQLFQGKFLIEQLERQDRMPLEPDWKERGCDWFFETTYLLTRRP